MTGRRGRREERHGQGFYIFCGLVYLGVGVGGGVAAAADGADGYVAGVAVILISIPMSGLCFSEGLIE